MTSEQPPALSEHFDGRAIIVEQSLHASTELRGNIHFEAFASLKTRQGLQLVWHKPEDFDHFLLNLDTSTHPANPIQGQAIQLIRDAFDALASDIHMTCLGTHGTIALRRMGMLEPWRDMGGRALMTLVRAIYQSMTEAGSPRFDPMTRQEGRIVNRRFLPPTVHSARVHTEPLQTANGQGLLMTIRLLYDTVKAEGTLQERLTALGYSKDHIQSLAKLSHSPGLTLVAGPTGSGKTTLLRHVFEALAQEMPDRSFLSIEDPPEYPMQRIAQVLVDTSADNRGLAYGAAIAGALRADPDYLMIGEIRHPEASSAALDAALTGHPVWSSIHAASALGIFQRLLSLLFVAKFADPLTNLQDPSVLSGLVYQRLLPKLCPHCSLKLAQVLQENSYRGDTAFIAMLRRLKSQGVELTSVRIKGAGCKHCKETGRSGLLVACEIVRTDQQLLYYLANRDQEESLAYARSLGLQTTAEQALDFIGEGLLDPRDAENCLGFFPER
ncbi:MAG: Flp pilus assembly complex ATPase component TadA [Desulfovibrio sp.]|nr:Flp pilus assembly complex ATPase component TadA [Desulfovibrio sp.]